MFPSREKRDPGGFLVVYGTGVILIFGAAFGGMFMRAMHGWWGPVIIIIATVVATLSIMNTICNYLERRNDGD